MSRDTEVNVEPLLRAIREDFYVGVPEKKFFQDRSILMKAITWPATWLKARGIAWTAERYFAVIRGQLTEIKKHGATGEIHYFPGYMMKCLQDHFGHNSDAYCDEGKRTAAAFDLVMGKVLSAPQLQKVQTAERTVDVLAQAHAVLADKRRGRKVAAKPAADDQLALF